MSADGGRLRVLTWNVHSCVGTRGFDPEAVLAVVKNLSPDVAALQEIDARQGLSGRLDTFGFFQDSLGWSAIEARTIRSAEGDYGHLLLSRLPIEEENRLDLSIAGREPRAAITCKINFAGKRINVLSAHLGLRRRERRRQLHAIVSHLNGIDDEGAVVLGDFNEWRRHGMATRMLCPPFEVAAALPSLPSRRPVLALDRIWCRAPLRALSAHVHGEAWDLSDHLPVMAELLYRREADVCARLGA